MTGTSYKTTAVALQNRRLARVTKKGGVWCAEATAAGRHFAQNETYPTGHWSALKAIPSTVPAPQTTAGRVREPKDTGLRPVDQMLADLAAAGGELRVDAALQGQWENLAASATRYGKVPDGKLLKVEHGQTWTSRVIRLVDKPDWMTVVLDPIPVSDQLRNPHPVVKAMRDDKDRLKMKSETRGRALRILDALAKAATERGYKVTPPTPQSGYRHPKGLAEITIQDHAYVIDIDELNVRTPHEPTKTELRDKERYSWKTIPTHDSVPSGRLRLRILNGWHVRHDKFTDTKTIDLATRLPNIVQELELRAADAEARRLERRRQADERKQQWERVQADALAQAREQHRHQGLIRQIERWEEARRLDRYLDAVMPRIQDLTGEEREAADLWLAWAKSHRERLDPLNEPITLSADPEFGPADLQPFMRGLSPYGPG